MDSFFSIQKLSATGAFCPERKAFFISISRSLPLMQPELNPHPASRCPFCGATKAVVTWRFCSQWCRDYADITPRIKWKAPNAPLGEVEPEKAY